MAMRRLRPKPKERRKVALPEDLIESMQEVVEVLQEADLNSDVEIDYGDAIQTDVLCGGRSDKKRNRFKFTYYCKPHRWRLDLQKIQIEDIASGHQSELLLHCCGSCENKFTFADDVCECDYEDDPDFGTFQFPEAVAKLKLRGIEGLNAVSTRADIIALLGEPGKKGGDFSDSALGYIWPWIWYQRHDCQLRFEFDKQDRIRNVTFSDADWKPGQ